VSKIVGNFCATIDVILDWLDRKEMFAALARDGSGLINAGSGRAQASYFGLELLRALKIS
jgi:hypothetical protein